MSTPAKFPHFRDLPTELQILIADQLPCDTYLLLLRSSQHTHKLLSNSPYLTRRATQLPLGAAYHEDWRTPLHFAAATANLPLLTAILSNSTRLYGLIETTRAVNLPDSWQLTPLLSAIASPPSNTRVQTVELLLRYGATTKNPRGHWWRRYDAPLVYAVMLRDYEVMRALLKAGADPNPVLIGLRYKVGLLWVAVVEGDVHALSLLLRLGEWRNERDWKVVMMYVADRPETADMARAFEEWLGEEKWMGRERGRYELREIEQCGWKNRKTYDLVNCETLWFGEWPGACYDIMQSLRVGEMVWNGHKHTWP